MRASDPTRQLQELDVVTSGIHASHMDLFREIGDPINISVKRHYVCDFISGDANMSTDSVYDVALWMNVTSTV